MLNTDDKYNRTTVWPVYHSSPNWEITTISMSKYLMFQALRHTLTTADYNRNDKQPAP